MDSSERFGFAAAVVAIVLVICGGVAGLYHRLFGAGIGGVLLAVGVGGAGCAWWWFATASRRAAKRQQWARIQEHNASQDPSADA